jgi:hypothetical protein
LLPPEDEAVTRDDRVKGMEERVFGDSFVWLCHSVLSLNFLVLGHDTFPNPVLFMESMGFINYLQPKCAN